jgi:2-keto-4-pentenoate hydratase/2-oxohepta-3-ene-1,7-dioic acid hydratase in catechol pathway
MERKTMTFSLATFRIDGTPAPVLSVDGRHYRLADLAPEVLAPDPAAGLMTVFANWASAEPALLTAVQRLTDGQVSGEEVPAPRVLEDWLTPLQYPNKVICTGANYYEHMQKDGKHTDFTKETKIPVFFLKPPTTTLAGQGKSVRYPVQSQKFDYELELAFVVGKRGRRIGREQAMDYVAGYTIGIDLSARDWQRHPKHLVKFDLFGGKAFDDSCPLGPGIVPARFVDEGNLQLQLRLNGELKQDANTKDMIWSIPEQIEKISEHVTLEPGDVVLTGTPSGVGLGTGIWTKAGDSLDAEITGLGSLHVEIVDDHPDAE